MIAHIFKYELPITDEVITLKLPEKYAICDIQNQNGTLCIWCTVDVHKPLIDVKFKIFGTGHQIIDIENLYYLKTVQMNDGLVWHVFVLEDEEE